MSRYPTQQEQPGDTWDEYYEEVIIDDGVDWDVELVEDTPVDFQDFSPSQSEHPVDESTLTSRLSGEEQKAEIVPIHRARDPPEARHDQLQPIEQLPRSSRSRISATRYDQPQAIEPMPFSATSRRSSDKQSNIPRTIAQKPQMLPDEEQPSSRVLAKNDLAMVSLEQASLTSKPEDLASLPGTVDSSTVEVEEDHISSREHRVVRFQGTTVIPYDNTKTYPSDPEREKNSPLKVCISLLLLLLLIFVLVLITLFFAVYVDEEPTEAPTMSPTFLPPLNPFDPTVSCSGRVTTLTDETVAKYETLTTDYLVPSVYSTWDHSIDSCHPANQAVLWLSTDSTAEDPTDLLQRYIMAFVYFATGGAAWRYQDKWLTEYDVCDWEGVGCTSEGGLLKMNLVDNGLKGPVISELGLLSKLQVLTLASNVLSGSMPLEVASLPDLRIVDLSQNRLVGTIPSHIGASAPTLEQLSLGGNSFSGSLPTELGKAMLLKRLDLGRNNFQGEIPTEMNHLTRLSFFNVESNSQITGRIATEYGQFTDLSFLSISNTAIRARIPRQYAALRKLEEFRVANTLVGGDIPAAVANMTSLKHLDLSGSRFRKALPSFLGTLGKLTHLSLHNNSLTGTIPTQLGLLFATRLLTLDDNLFTGTVPSECASLSKLEVFTLHHSFLTGRIPDQVCNLRDLELEIFTVPCPTRTEEGDHLGITCAVPACCSACIGPLQTSLRP